MSGPRPKPRRIPLTFPGPVADRVDHPDGSVEVVFDVVGTTWLERLLIRVGPDVRVLEPADLTELGPQAAGACWTSTADPDGGHPPTSEPGKAVLRAGVRRRCHTRPVPVGRCSARGLDMCLIRILLLLLLLPELVMLIGALGIVGLLFIAPFVVIVAATL